MSAPVTSNGVANRIVQQQSDAEARKDGMHVLRTPWHQAIPQDLSTINFFDAVYRESSQRHIIVYTRFMHRPPGQKIISDDYLSGVKEVGTFATIEEFWGLYSRMRRPNELPNISDIHLFRKGTRPVWEDNPKGGKWIVRLKKGLSSRYWENLVIAVIGDNFGDSSEITGAVISIRNNEDILSLWNTNASEGRIGLRIRDTMKKLLDLPGNCTMEYKAHTAALTDGSSFKNTETYR
ncbi:hypothetical protein SmJEL517_g01211 [Synchytrium microbalum]|uniref:Uncharacterized protein n=1 Tax=Synchytrium microbalum TaxID=1806994 RepID=A0A507CB28_9FUNG|nr:uncharacterized protein SmJEL517_g01211 [Synchytrium microbalum]TPX36558.1 hypothetical protein SmJEL517_g01211 [Synchytrium microbalum]